MPPNRRAGAAASGVPQRGCALRHARAGRQPPLRRPVPCPAIRSSALCLGCHIIEPRPPFEASSLGERVLKDSPRQGTSRAIPRERGPPDLSQGTAAPVSGAPDPVYVPRVSVAERSSYLFGGRRAPSECPVEAPRHPLTSGLLAVDLPWNCSEMRYVYGTKRCGLGSRSNPVQKLHFVLS